MIYLIKIFFLINILTFSLNAKENNKIIFKINNKIFTNIDFERRINYIQIINKIKSDDLSNINKNEILDDYISSLIFFEFNLKNNVIKEKLDLKVQGFYSKNIFDSNVIDKYSDLQILNIKKNIEIDLVRKLIVENFLNSKKNLLNKKSSNLDIIYNYNLNYISVDKRKIDNLLIKKIKNRKDFLNFKNNLEDKNISFFYKDQNIDDNSIISNNIKNQIIKNEKISILIESEYITIMSLEKNLESYDGIFVKLVNFKTKKKLIGKDLNCNYLKSENDKIAFKEYEYSKLNDQIKNNLKSVNDYILINNENIFNYIFLCELRYDEKLLNSLNFNKKINTLVKNIQIKFIKKYKTEYKFENFYE